MALGRPFIRNVVKHCLAELERVGFQRCTGGIATLRIDDAFQGWIGLNTATRFGDDSMVVNPMMGVRHDPIHRIIAEVTGSPYTRYAPPTIGQPLYALASELPTMRFTFRKDEPIAEVMNDLVQQVEAFGLPYIRENCSLDALIERIPKDCLAEEADERMVVAVYLRDGESAASTEIERRRAARREAGRSLARLEEFVGAFEEWRGPQPDSHQTQR